MLGPKRKYHKTGRTKKEILAKDRLQPLAISMRPGSAQFRTRQNTQFQATISSRKMTGINRLTSL